MSAEPEGNRSTWTIGALLDWTEAHFKKRGLPSPRLDAELLLADVLATERLRLYTDYHKPVDPAERARFRELVVRRSRLEPVAYLTGSREFYSLGLEVGPAVLVPRPETEHLVDEALRLLRERSGATDDTPARVLDLGTGSGCIAIAIAKNRPEVSCLAVDIDAGALTVARRNVERHGLLERIRLLEGDLFAPVENEPPFDLIVSNPPYVSRAELPTLMDDVRLYEPERALVDTRSPDGDGLGFYRAIANEAGRHLARGGSLLLEVGHRQAEAVCRLLTAAGFDEPRRLRDYGGIDRVVAATRG